MSSASGPGPTEKLPFVVPEVERYPEGTRLGWGGMGVVSAVHDVRLRREVAYKRVLPGADPSADARLAREAWIAAHLEHPGIVPIYDAGVSPDGRLFYTMRLVRGATLAVALRSAGPDDLPRLVRHVLAACEAVAYAHSVGVLHRDLKPANIMVGSFSETQVVDWGLASIPDERHRAAWGALGLTELDEATAGGTPGYTSPEQENGGRVGPAADVYSLGVILQDVLKACRVGPQVELQAIVSRACAPDPAARYPDAAALAEDLHAWFDGRRISAYAYTPMDLLRRFLVAWRAPLGVAAAAALILAIGGAWAVLRTLEERNRAVDAEQRALGALADADRYLGQALVTQARDLVGRGMRGEAEILASHALRLGARPEARGVLMAWAARPRPEKQVWSLDRPCERGALLRPDRAVCLAEDRVWAVDLSPEGPREAWDVSADGALHVIAAFPHLGVATATDIRWLDPDTGASLGRILTPHGQSTWMPAGEALFAYNSAWLFLHDRSSGTISEESPCPGHHGIASVAWGAPPMVLCADGTLVERREDGWSERGPSGLYGDQTGAMQSTSGGRLVVGSLRGRIGIIGEEPWMETGLGQITRLIAEPTGGRMAVVGVRGVGVWDPEAKGLVARIPGSAWRDAAWRGASQLVVLGTHEIGLWTLPLGAGPTEFATHAGLSDIAVSPDGSRLAFALGDGVIEVRDAASGRVLVADGGDITGVSSPVCKRTAFSPDGSFLAASCGTEPWMRVYDTRTWIRRDGAIASVVPRMGVLRPSTIWASTYGGGGPVRSSGGPPETLSGIFGVVDGVNDPSHQFAILLDREGQIWRLESVGAPRVLGVARGGVAVGSGGGRVVVGVTDAVSSLGDGIPWRTAVPRLTDLAVSGDGRWVAVGGLDGSTSILDAETGSVLARLPPHKDRVSAVVFAEDRLYTSSWDRTVRVWGLGPLTDEPEIEAETLERAWGLDLEAALRSSSMVGVGTR